MSLTLAIFMASFLGLMLLGLPVAWAMASASLIWIGVTGQWSFLSFLPERIFQGMNVFVLMALPLFLLAGELINEGGITKRLVTLANLAFGWMRGGLAQVAIGTSILFSGITSIALGDIAALGKVFVPTMVAQGYTPAYAGAVIAASSIIGPMIPPSLIVVLYGSLTGVSIGALFAACIMPGLLIGLVQMILVATQARRHGFPRVEAERTPAAFVRATGGAAVPLMIPVIILAGILGGLMTPTEAGAAAAFYAFVLATMVYRTIVPRALAPIFSRSMLFSAQLLIIVGCGAMFSWVMGMENVPGMLQGAIERWKMTPGDTMFAFNILLLIVGMFLDAPAALILFAPILSTAATSAGIDPVHFGAVMILNLNIGLLTPPVGFCLFAAERIAGCGMPALVRAITPFLGANLIALGLLSAFPPIALWLPRVLGF